MGTLKKERKTAKTDAHKAVSKLSGTEVRTREIVKIKTFLRCTKGLKLSKAMLLHVLKGQALI